MFTVVETPLFQKQWPLYWSEEERGEFAAYIAECFPTPEMWCPSLAVFARSAGGGLVLVSLGVFASSTSRVLPRKKSYFY